MTYTSSRSSLALAALIFSLGLAASVGAQTLAPQERMCDPTFEDCRADLLTYIMQETEQIDVAFWMMSDARYSNALVAAQQRGVKIRVLMDPRCTSSHPACKGPMDQLAAAGVPMRNRVLGGILHWKMMLFASQAQVEFSGANYVPFELAPDNPGVNFTDEIVYYSNDPSVVRSMMTRFDDLWTSTVEFTDYANISAPLTRTYPTNPIDPELNFPPDDSYRARAVRAYDAEQQKIDVFMFRITDLNHTQAMVRAINRGIPVRLITDEEEYRNPARLWDAYNVDIMYRAGIGVRLDAHQGINHAKGVVLYGSGLAIFGSSNWTSPSSDSQREHNYFTRKTEIFNWLAALFDRKWNNASGHSETKPFVPLPPDQPSYVAPANGAADTSGVVLQWYAGLWGHVYDIYFGTTPDPPLLVQNRELGPSQFSTDYRKFAITSTLQPGTKYYWRIVSKTMAQVTAAGPVWSFTTAGTPPQPGDPSPGALPAGWSAADVGATGAPGGSTFSNGTFSVTGAGADVWGTADAFQFAYRSLDGDGTILARGTTIQNVNAWTKAGVMMRSALSPSGAHGFMLAAASSTKGVPFQRRPTDGGTSVTSPGSPSTAPRWLKLIRAGSVITGYESADGANWTIVGSDTFTMGSSILVGLAGSSHVSGVTATATFDNVTVTAANPPPPDPPPSGVPTGWAHADIGAVPIAGDAIENGGAFTLTGAGADIWGNADALHYAYATLNGDGTIVARVASIPQEVNSWVKAGVMIRASVSADSPHAFMLASAARGTAFQRRAVAGDVTTSTAGTASTAPQWMKIERSGQLFSAYESADGLNWTLVGTDTIAMPQTVLVGLAVTSHTTGASATCSFDAVSIQ